MHESYFYFFIKQWFQENNSLTQWLQKHSKDVSNFDSQFTNVSTAATPTDSDVICNIGEDAFNGFSFMNPEFVQYV